MRRAGFGVTSDELNSLEGLDYDGIVDDLLDPPDTSWMGDHWVWRFHREQSSMISGFGAGEYWLYRMEMIKSPFIEKVTIFWHNIFATGYPKVVQGKGLSNQIAMFRRNGLGRAPMALAISPDNRLFVTESNRHRIQIFEMVG